MATITSDKSRFRNQNYSKVREECASNNKLFEDPEFSLAKALSGQKFSGVEWKRPTEISASPRLVVGRLNSNSIAQGKLGNCWFVAACCSLAQEQDLWKTVVPNHEDQDYNNGKHSGLFHFRIWRFGRWMSVTIDDRLPTINGQLILAHSKNKDEFWCSLLEKAYAKLFGSYDALDGGNLVDALVDFTGGYAERFDLEEEGARTDDSKRTQLFEHLRNEKKHHTLMCSAVGVPPGAGMESETPLGLIRGHAYCITDVRSLDIKQTGLFALFKGRERLNMIRLRNPWGEVEWKGPFSDGSAEWNKISKHDREKCGLTFDDDGEFWMTFEDFCVNFSTASACHLVNTSWFSFSQTWNEALFFGEWSYGPSGSSKDRSGGCSNNQESFLRNPQYCFEVKTETDKLMVMLQQPDKRGLGDSDNNKLHSIGFHVYKVELNRKYRVHNAWETSVGGSNYMETRNVFKTIDVTRGRYIVLPTTFEPRKQGPFLLRLFTKHNVHFRELVSEAPKQPWLVFLGRYRGATHVRVREGKNIKHGNEAASSYFVVSCEGTKVKGHVEDKTAHPKWNQSAAFYHKSKKPKIKIQVFHHKAIRDVLVGEGEVEVEAAKSDRPVAVRVPLVLKKKKQREGESGAGVGGGGEVYVEVFTTKDIKQL